MTPDKKSILRDLKQNLENQIGDNFKDILLFGSQAKSIVISQDSDFDILVLVKDNSGWKLERQISDICYEIDLKYGIITDTHVIGDNEMNTLRAKQPIFVNAIKNGVSA